jgi:hypothetical protein
MTTVDTARFNPVRPEPVEGSCVRPFRQAQGERGFLIERAAA